MKSKYLISALLLNIPLFLTGCLVGTFDYKVSPDMVKSETSYSCTVSVDDFKDERPEIGSNRIMLYLIPGVPYASLYYNIPEDGRNYATLRRFDFNPTIQLAQAAELSLKQSNLFKKVSSDNGYDDNDDADFIFTGTIYSTLYRQRLLSYCVSAACPAIWVLGAPGDWTQCHLKLGFSLVNVKTGKVLWTYTAANRKSRCIWLYYWGGDVKDYVPVMRECMNEAIINLIKTLKENPNLLK
jgi:hypothetical protein